MSPRGKKEREVPSSKGKEKTYTVRRKKGKMYYRLGEFLTKCPESCPEKGETPRLPRWGERGEKGTGGGRKNPADFQALENGEMAFPFGEGKKKGASQREKKETLFFSTTGEGSERGINNIRTGQEAVFWERKRRKEKRRSPIPNP